MARARVKLDAAEREVAQLNQSLQDANRNADLAMARLVECQHSFDDSSSAETKRLAMMEEIVKQHPSPELHRLIHDVTAQKSAMDGLAEQTREMETIGRTLNASQQHLQSALGFASKAERAIYEIARLEREDLRIRPQGGHEIHVVQGDGVVANPRRPGSVHSAQRDRRPVSNIGGVDADDHRTRQLLLDIGKQQQKVHEELRKAQASTRKGYNMMEAAVTKLTQYSRLHGSVPQVARFILLGGFAATTTTVSSISAIRELQSQITQIQDVRQEHHTIVSQLQKDLKMDCCRAEQTLQQTRMELDVEKDRIFEALRSQFYHSPNPLPSAPESEADGVDNTFANFEASRSSFTRGSRLSSPTRIESSEPPVMIPTERLSTGIRIASVVPTAPPEALDLSTHQGVPAQTTLLRVHGLESTESSQRQFIKADIVKS